MIMPQLYQLKKIKNLKFFSDFKWNSSSPSTPNFGKYNIIYGFNGSGKTTLSDFFHSLESQEDYVSYFNEKGIEFELAFADNNSGDNQFTITHKKVAEKSPSFKVFHGDYVKDNIRKKEGLDHIYTVGKMHHHLLEEITKKKHGFYLDNKKREELSLKLSTKENDFETFTKGRGLAIKAESIDDRSAYNKNHYVKDFEKLITTVTLTDEELRQSRSLINEKELDTITLDKFIYCPKNSFFTLENISTVLTQSPGNLAIEEYSQNSQLNAWAEKGLNIHSALNDGKCHFCDNILTEERLGLLKSHFDDSYTKLTANLNNTIREIDDFINNTYKLQIEYPPAKSLYDYNDLHKRYNLEVEKLRKINAENIQRVQELRNFLLHKKENLTNTRLEDVNTVIEIFKSIQKSDTSYDDIKKIIIEHNDISQNFKIKISDTKIKLKQHFLSEKSNEHHQYSEEINSLKNELKTTTDALNILNAEIEDLNIKAKDYASMAQKINSDIKEFFGREEIKLSIEENCYKITRNNEVVDKLSTGEENALALIYFFNSLESNNIDPNNTIIVLDDPISSFDSSFYYHAVAYIYTKTIHFNQIFILTHKFSFYKQLVKSYPKKDGTHLYLLKRENGNPQLSKPHKLISAFEDEYAYFFSIIYQFAQGTSLDIDYLHMPNIARQVLESFLTFKVPCVDTDFLDLALKLSGKNSLKTRTALRLLNDKSHLQKIKGSESLGLFTDIDEVRKTLRDLLDYIYKYDCLHYTCLEKELPADITRIIRPTAGQQESTVLSFEPVSQSNLKKVPLFDLKVSAGTGNQILEDLSAEDIEVSNKFCDFAVKISGNSMEPVISDDDILLIKSCEEISIGRIGIFSYNGDILCKKKIFKNEKWFLHSENKDYPDIPVENDSDLICYGEFIEKYANDIPL